MRVLLVWELVPEETQFFLIENPTEKQIEYLKQANGNFFNLNNVNEGMTYLNYALMDPEYIDGSEPVFCECSVWKNKQVETPIDGPIDRVFWSGFVL